MTFRPAHAVAWDAPAPVSLADVPNQLGRDCRAAYFHAAKHFYAPGGAIVDGGTLAGGSSRALIEGCRASGRPLTGPFLYAFDIFRCDEYTAGFFSKHFPGAWASGDSFRSVYEQSVAQYSAHVNIVEGDITEFREWSGPPIDVLGVDIWKTETLAEHCIRVFFPHLRVGSIVLQQDYNHCWLPYIHSFMEVFSGHFEKIHETKQWGTVVFQTVRTLTPDEIEQGIARHRIPQERKLLVEAAYRRAQNPHTAFWIKLADCLRVAQFEGLPAALEALERAKVDRLQFQDNFGKVFAAEIEKFELFIRAVFAT